MDPTAVSTIETLIGSQGLPVALVLLFMLRWDDLMKKMLVCMAQMILMQRLQLGLDDGDDKLKNVEDILG